MAGSDLQAARERTFQSREELATALDHLRESLGVVEGEVPDLRGIGSRAIERLSNNTEDFLKEALHSLDQNALISWFAVFLTGCAFGGLFVASSGHDPAIRREGSVREMGPKSRLKSAQQSPRAA